MPDRSPWRGWEGTGGGARGALARTLASMIRAVAWLALPLSLMLCLQWPLREIVQAYSREANDLGQVLFALYVSVAITAATRRRAHLCADALAHRYPARRRRRLDRVAALLVLLPWSVYLLITAAPIMAGALAHWERFPETFNPGYFLVKIAVGVLGLLVAVQAVIDAAGTPADRGEP
ncbi:MAG: TRAP transporter small permease subunit [Casimicrobiaceae bacterium]